MENYYEEILNEIRRHLDKKECIEAMSLIKTELSMPYIPEDVEKKLREYMKEANFEMHADRETAEASMDSLLEKLKGSSLQQLSAAGQLSKRNLRECIEEIQQYLLNDPFAEAAALVVESIAEQEIQEEFVWMKDGVEYAFYGDSVTPCAESKGFLKALAYLQEWLDKYPDMYEMAKTLLVHEVYMFLPLSYEEEEGESLAFDVFENVCEMMGQDDLSHELKEKIGIYGMN